jgi:hypothetical protein
LLPFLGIALTFASACNQPVSNDCASGGGSLLITNQADESVQITASDTQDPPVTATISAGASYTATVPTGSFNVVAVGQTTQQTLLSGQYTITCDATTSVTIQPEPKVTLNVSLGGTGHGSITALPQGLVCNSSSCSGSYDQDTPVQLTAAASSDSRFTGWGGACTSAGTQTQCTVTLAQATSATAQFDLLQFSSVISVTGSGQGTVTSDPSGIQCGAGNNACGRVFNDDTPVKLTAAPATGSHLTSWSGDCASAGQAPECDVTISGPLNAGAQFDLDTETLTVATAVAPSTTVAPTGVVTSTPSGLNCGNGNTACKISGLYGSMVTLTAVPGTGSAVSSWSGPCAGSGLTCVVSMSQSQTITVTFGPQMLALSLNVDTQGLNGTLTSNIDPSIDCKLGSSAGCKGTYPYGTTMTITPTATQEPGYPSEWETGPCQGPLSTTSSDPCTFTLKSNVSISVIFTGGHPR